MSERGASRYRRSERQQATELRHRGYRAERPLSRAEQTLLPLGHIGYELSEIDYFRTVADEPRNAEIAWRTG
ncbi:hypothetical protein BOX37_06220 [Nocardia mangyaensis]|uniref:Uncharacterized protein n=1 Tax=Nocardia mangyaensis TaxID=2213200 RepID=A0A1J0VNR4_9NOCA|nr:hypothetical protein BOX37_06220 [Nocardia mangyaensis]